MIKKNWCRRLPSGDCGDWCKIYVKSRKHVKTNQQPLQISFALIYLRINSVYGTFCYKLKIWQEIKGIKINAWVIYIIATFLAFH